MTNAVLAQSAATARQADWRFLLPRASHHPFEHLLLIGGSSALEASLLDLGVAHRVSRALRPGERADAVIVLAGAGVSLESVASLLEDDGVLYWEVDRRVLGQVGVTPARALKRVTRLGLSPTAAYWVKPGFPERQMYLPVRAAGAFRWYLDTLYRTPTRLRRMLRAGFRGLAADRRGLAVTAPCYAITAVRGAARPADLIERASLEGVSIDETTDPVLLAYGETEWNRIVLLLFGSGASAPKAAIKLPRTPAFNEQIEWEDSILRELASNLSPSMRGSIPRSSLFHWNDLAVSVETCVSGSSLNSRAGPAASGGLVDLHLTASWLAEFHHQTTIDRVPAREWVTRHLIDGVCKDYTATFGVTPAETHLFAMLSQRLEDAGQGMLPIVWQHADFGPPNVFLDHGGVSVIDWETARRGPALLDLLYLVTDWSAAVARCETDAERLEHFESLFCAATPASPLALAVHREIAEYMRRVEVPQSVFAFLLVYTFLEKALERVRRLKTLKHPDPARAPQRGCRVGDAASRAGNRFVAHVGVLARHAHRLFGEKHTPGASCADVTVAVATMNRPSALARCMSAIIAGQMLPAEVIVVDQSTGLGTANLVAAAGWDRAVPVTYLRQQRGGLAASRNAAIAHATRPIVVFTDDDCVPDARWLFRIVAAFDSAEQPDAVTGAVLPLGPERPGFYAVSTRASRVRAVYRGRSLPWTIGSGGNTAVKREWLERTGGFDERLGAGSPGFSAEDMDVLYRLLRAGATLQYEPDAIVFHERQDSAHRLASRPSYGFGMGAFCALWARRRDAYAIWMLGRWCGDRSYALLAACVRRRWRRVREELLMLRGAARGITYGLTS